MTTTGLVHPSRLFRSNSRERVFAAPSNINSGLDDNFDWGIARIPVTSRMCIKNANVSVFVSLLAILGFFQGISYAYFKNTAKIWMKQYGFSQLLTEYLVNSTHIMCGVFGIFIAYWGNRIHRISWLSALTIFHAIAGITLLIPELYHPSFSNFDAKNVSNSDFLCRSTNGISNLKESAEGKMYIAVGFFLMHQLFFSFSLTSWICHGLSYVDDHIRMKNSSVCICIIFVTSEFGKQIGLYYAYIPDFFQRHVFLSSAWLSSLSLTLVIGICISMFPRELPSKILERGVASILDLTVEQEPVYHSEDFFPVMKKLFKIPTIIFITLAAAVMTTAITNYEIIKKNFSRVRMGDSMNDPFTSYSEPSLTQFFTNFVVQNFKIMSAAITTVMIMRFKPALKNLIYWLCSHYIKVALLFIAGIFTKCNNVIHTDYGAFRSYCNLNCGCSMEDFYPVCIRGSSNLTFYSPCYAGCTTRYENSYQNCTCHGKVATAGFCDGDNCWMIWFFSELNNAVRSGLLAAAVVINIFIILKASPKEYKAVSLGLYFAIVQITPYFPFKLIYDVVKDTACVHYNDKNICTVFNSNFALYMDIVTSVLLGLSTFLVLMVLCFKDQINLYGKKMPVTEVAINDQPLRDNINEPNTNTYGDDDIDNILRQIEEEEQNIAGRVSTTAL